MEPCGGHRHPGAVGRRESQPIDAGKLCRFVWAIIRELLMVVQSHRMIAHNYCVLFAIALVVSESWIRVCLLVVLANLSILVAV